MAVLLLEKNQNLGQVDCRVWREVSKSGLPKTELGKVVRVEFMESEDRSGSTRIGNRVFVDGDRLGPYVKIRNWKPGDYYKPMGWPGGKLKKLFQRARIPRSQRSRWPVIENDSIVVWVASFPVSREFAPGRRSHKIVSFEVAEAHSI